MRNVSTQFKLLTHLSEATHITFGQGKIQNPLSKIGRELNMFSYFFYVLFLPP